MYYKDKIIEEVWANRKIYAEKHRHDLDAMVNDLKHRQSKTGKKIVDRRLLFN